MPDVHAPRDDPEALRLVADAARTANWKRWGPYLSDRQWGTVREDYSATGDAWDYMTHDAARSRAYRWGEDGLLGLCDREGRLCFAWSLWNERDPILKERLFGLTGPEGNHGEDVKECYHHLDATPTASWLRALYRYPQRAFPYADLVAENRRRGRDQPEYELLDTGVLDGDRFFDVVVEYAKASPDDVLIRCTVVNQGPQPATLHVLPTLWFRNTWSWGRSGEGYWPKPALWVDGDGAVVAEHVSLGRFQLRRIGDGPAPPVLVTENETNTHRLFGTPAPAGRTKDAFHRHVVEGERGVADGGVRGTRAAMHSTLTLGPREAAVLRLRLHADGAPAIGVTGFDGVMEQRRAEADTFYGLRIPAHLDGAARDAVRHAYAGLVWTKQFYHLGVREWLEGDPALPLPEGEEQRRHGRNADWPHLYNRDVVSMPDGWEYPWYAAWDLAFHCVAFARIDPQFAKDQLQLLLREWYMHPNGQLPAYEFGFGDVNPPVHAWACWRVYKATGRRGERDTAFLQRAFHKLLINFTWWVNRKDPHGDNIFAGGFLGLDNIGVFDRSQGLPGGGTLAQADGTAWMAFYCGTMLSIALELAAADAAYEDVASKFFEHFVAISDAMNRHGGTGLWDEQDGFYYDQLLVDGGVVPLRLRSMVGVIPLFAVEVIEDDVVARLPGFRRRMQWFLDNRQDLAQAISYMAGGGTHRGHRLLAIPSRDRLVRVLSCVLDADELLSEHGVRSLSRAYRDQPYTLNLRGQEYTVRYRAAESDSGLFGGNSNWRGPVWFPLNYLLIEALERYHHFYGDGLRVECPTGSGRMLTLAEVAGELSRRLAALFVPDAAGGRPWQGGDERIVGSPLWRDLPLFHEYFDGDTGRGCGASHQTGWTALVARLFDEYDGDHEHPA